MSSTCPEEGDVNTRLQRGGVNRCSILNCALDAISARAEVAARITVGTEVRATYQDCLSRRVLPMPLADDCRELRLRGFARRQRTPISFSTHPGLLESR